MKKYLTVVGALLICIGLLTWANEMKRQQPKTYKIEFQTKDTTITGTIVITNLNQ